MFESLYRYYYFDLSTRDRSNVSGLSLYVNGFNNTLRPINLTFIVIYEKYCTINCQNGTYTPKTSED